MLAHSLLKGGGRWSAGPLEPLAANRRRRAGPGKARSRGGAVILWGCVKKIRGHLSPRTGRATLVHRGSFLGDVQVRVSVEEDRWDLVVHWSARRQRRRPGGVAEERIKVGEPLLPPIELYSCDDTDPRLSHRRRRTGEHMRRRGRGPRKEGLLSMAPGMLWPRSR